MPQSLIETRYELCFAFFCIAMFLHPSVKRRIEKIKFPLLTAKHHELFLCGTFRTLLNILRGLNTDAFISFFFLFVPVYGH